MSRYDFLIILKREKKLLLMNFKSFMTYTEIKHFNILHNLESSTASSRWHIGNTTACFCLQTTKQTNVILFFPKSKSENL